MTRNLLAVISIIAFCAAATVVAPIVVEGGDKIISKTIVRRAAAKRSKTVERSRGVDDCDLPPRAPAKKLPAVELIIR